MVKGAQVADQTRDNVLFMLCHGLTVGTINRWLGGDATKAMHYFALCNPGVMPLILPLPVPRAPET